MDVREFQAWAWQRELENLQYIERHRAEIEEFLDAAIERYVGRPASASVRDAESSDANQPLHLSDEQIAEALDRNPTGRAIYDLVTRSDAEALHKLQRRIRASTRRLPPYDPGDKESAISEHLWDVIRKKTGYDPRPAVVLRLANGGKFEFLPYEVEMRLIDDARKASAKKRVGTESTCQCSSY